MALIFNMTHKIDEFTYRANPNEWLEVSDELNNSIELLTTQSKMIFMKSDTWDGVPTKKLMNSRSIFLLMGFVIENLIKGLLVFDNPEYVNKGSFSPELKSHNLKDLCYKIKDVDLDIEEEMFLNTLSSAIPDWGRYPIPLRFQLIKDEVQYSKDINESYINIRKLFRNKLINRLKGGWKSGLSNKKTNVQISFINL